MDLSEDKLELAKELGADHVVNAREQDSAEEIQRLGGADAAIDTAVSPTASEAGGATWDRGKGIMTCRQREYPGGRPWKTR